MRETFDIVIANTGVMNCPFGHTADAADPERAQALWAKSEKMAGERF